MENQQLTNGSGSVNLPATPSSDPGQILQQLLAAQTEIATLKAERDQLNGRLGGQTTKINELTKEKTDLQAQITRVNAEFEGFKAQSALELKTKSDEFSTIKQQFEEQSGKLQQFELTDKTRSLIKQNFPDLLTNFENDPLIRKGILETAKEGDEPLKAALQTSLNALKGIQTQAVNDTLKGTTPPTPGSQPTTEAKNKNLVEQWLAGKLDPNTPDYAEALRLGAAMSQTPAN